MANSLKKQTQGDAMNIPPGIDRIETSDGSHRYRLCVDVMDHWIRKRPDVIDQSFVWLRLQLGGS